MGREKEEKLKLAYLCELQNLGSKRLNEDLTLEELEQEYTFHRHKLEEEEYKEKKRALEEETLTTAKFLSEKFSKTFSRSFLLSLLPWRTSHDFE